jgi:uncharacterized protein
MSQKNVEIVQTLVDAFNARDREGILRLVDPEIEFHSAAEQKTYRGNARVVEYREDVAAVMDDFQLKDSRFLDGGRDRVVHLYRVVGRGVGSDVPVSRDVGAVWELREGKLVRWQDFLDQREALEAVGLSE